jgi:hypothetical protein
LQSRFGAPKGIVFAIALIGLTMMLRCAIVKPSA